MSKKTVSQIARHFDVSPDMIRHYTKLKLLEPTRDPENQYRRYSARDERRLKFLLSAKKLGLSLKNISEVFNVAETGDTTCPLVKTMIQLRLKKVQLEIEEAQLLLNRMQCASQAWAEMPDLMPDEESICYLIESSA